MTPQTNTYKVKEEKYNVCHDCQMIGNQNCAHFDTCQSWASYPIELRNMFISDYKCKVPLSIIFEKAFDMGQSKSYTPSEVNTMLEKLMERCIAASSDFLSEGNIREIDYSDLLNK